jgi:hypothetical protein
MSDTYSLSADNVDRLCLSFRQWSEAAIAHADHQCPAGVAALSIVGTIGTVLWMLGLTDTDVYARLARIDAATGDALADAAETSGYSGPPITAEEITGTDITALIDAITADAENGR